MKNAADFTVVQQIVSDMPKELIADFSQDALAKHINGKLSGRKKRVIEKGA